MHHFHEFVCIILRHITILHKASFSRHRVDRIKKELCVGKIFRILFLIIIVSVEFELNLILVSIHLIMISNIKGMKKNLQNNTKKLQCEKIYKYPTIFFQHTTFKFWAKLLVKFFRITIPKI